MDTINDYPMHIQAHKDQDMKKDARFNLYMNAERRAQIDALAERLHEQGVKGMYTGKGDVNVSAVIGWLIEQELARQKLGG